MVVFPIIVDIVLGHGRLILPQYHVGYHNTTGMGGLGMFLSSNQGMSR